MNQYTIYCTKEQALRAYMLGAPLEEEKPYAQIVEVGIAKGEFGQSVGVYKCIPTAEQMCGWLSEKGFDVSHVSSLDMSYFKTFCWYNSKEISDDIRYKTLKEAILASINIALDYLERKEEEV